MASENNRLCALISVKFRIVFLVLVGIMVQFFTSFKVKSIMGFPAILCFLFLLNVVCFRSESAVILQYHHVSNNTPISTSVSPQQFEKHLRYLKQHNFNVVPLNTLIDAIKNQQPLPDKTVAITFDDAYLDILTQAKPLLDHFNFPFTIFINPALVSQRSKHYLTWQQLKQMANEGVIIANHGYYHDSLARIPKNLSEAQWLNKYAQLLEQAEKIIKIKTGQSWRYFAYPYGEFSQAGLAWITQQNFIGFGQQSGAVGLHSNLAALPRFPASQPYDKLTTLKDKLYALPFNLTIKNTVQRYIYRQNELTSATFTLHNKDFTSSLLNCYVTGLGKQKIHWHNNHRFTVTFTNKLPIGRIRANCTAPSKIHPSRFYWYSHPWFILYNDGSWFAL